MMPDRAALASMLDALEMQLVLRIADNPDDPLLQTAFEAEADVILQAAAPDHVDLACSRLQRMRTNLPRAMAAACASR